MNSIIEPQHLLRDVLLSVKQPARYVGGEFQLKPVVPGPQDYRIGLCFPDLYEIGMANHAIKILYDLLNRIEGVACERVFAPAPDFENVLRSRDIPLYTLETGTPLHRLDMLCFSVGYELSATNILNVLELGGIPLKNSDRGDEHPIVIAGGPAVTNPLQFARFFDGVYIGEAEAQFPDIIIHARDKKRDTGKRAEILTQIHEYSCIWHDGTAQAARAADMSFTRSSSQAEDAESVRFTYFTVPTIKPVQDHGVVEIMRGCPNGCRFCHAGELYKPYRQRSYAEIRSAVDQMVRELGYRDVTLSSLSSGDHPQILPIAQTLTGIYSRSHVSFSLPSLKVDTFSLPLLSQIAAVRRSGLTFAVETPDESFQRAMNKEVPAEQVASIVKEAKKLGWKSAKFYFMTGLPFVPLETEAEQIAEYVGRIQRESGIAVHVNVGTFIPKPHTPFQWAPLLDPGTAWEHLLQIKRTIMSRVKKAKVSFQNPFISFIEGVISRGSLRSGELIEEAFRRGARLDAWDEYLDTSVWEEVFRAADWDVEQEICRARDFDEPLPWESVRLASTTAYLRREYRRAEQAVRTGVCEPDCTHNCGVCAPAGAQQSSPDALRPIPAPDEELLCEKTPDAAVEEHRMTVLMQYRRDGKALYISHLHCMQMFEKAFQRSGAAVSFTQGFNPKPVMEFLQPLPLGIAGERELLSVSIDTSQEAASAQLAGKLREQLNRNLPEGFYIEKAAVLHPGACKSLTALYGASDYILEDLDTCAFNLLDTITAETPAVELRETRETSAVLRVWEPTGVQPKKKKEGEGSRPASGNLMKLIDAHMNKYTFLSTYRVTRKCMYTINGKEYFNELGIEE
jgi:radical SAM family uncharacterized protein/radical SAM-linked protein